MINTVNLLAVSIQKKQKVRTSENYAGLMLFPLQNTSTYMLYLQEANLKIQEKKKKGLSSFCSIEGTEFSL